MNNLKAMGIFVARLLCGIGLMYAGVARGPDRVIETLWVTMISEHALHAKMIHDGKAPDVQRMLEGSFVQSALGLKQLRLPEPSQHVALWDIRSYYELSGKPIPLQLTNLLASLPPRPPSACRIKREKLQKE